MMIGMMVKLPASDWTISRVTGYAPLPYQSPTVHDDSTALMTPITSITKNAGLRNTNAMSKRAIDHSWTSPARTPDDAGDALIAAGAAGTRVASSMASAERTATARFDGTSKRNSA